MIKAVIFDMDGTLLDSMHVWDNVGDIYLSQQGISVQKDLQEYLSTMSIEESCHYLNEHYLHTKTVKQIQVDIEQIVLQRYEQDIPLKPGVKECIEHCLAQEVTLGVLSASSETMVNVALKRLGILSSFSFIMTCEKAGYSKRDPNLYHKTLEQFNLKGEECIFVEDAYHAIKCMKQEGYYVVAVYDDTNKQDWEKIGTIADEQYYDLSKWEVTTCKRY